MRKALIGSLAVVAAIAGTAAAQNVTVTVENMLAPGGFSFTPVWMALHDGSFDTYDAGAMASSFPGLTELAEGGDTSFVSAAFTASGAGIAGGVQTTLAEGNGAPVFSPGEMASTNIAVGDATVNRFFSFASMVVPSNDLFISNDDAMAWEIFDAGGNFNGPMVIEVYGHDVRDAGTEVNDAFGGAAFSTNGGASVDEAVAIRAFFTDGSDGAYLSSFVGTGTADGGTIDNAFIHSDLIARITIVPAPSTLGLGLLGLAGFVRRHR
jgi:hypothetical protein